MVNEPMSPPHWREAFLAVSAVLGEPLDASLAVLGGASTSHAPGLVAALRSSSRDVRAHAIARAVTGVVVGLDEMRLA